VNERAGDRAAQDKGKKAGIGLVDAVGNRVASSAPA
jgi:hypothetical protein